MSVEDGKVTLSNQNIDIRQKESDENEESIPMDWTVEEETKAKRK